MILDAISVLQSLLIPVGNAQPVAVNQSSIASPGLHFHLLYVVPGLVHSSSAFLAKSNCIWQVHLLESKENLDTVRYVNEAEVIPCK